MKMQSIFGLRPRETFECHFKDRNHFHVYTKDLNLFALHSIGKLNTNIIKRILYKHARPQDVLISVELQSLDHKLRNMP